MAACTGTRVDVCTKIKTHEKITECAVCNDRSTGKHYGVLTCEGCKSFFKRTVRNNTSYKCRNKNSCSIERTTRSRCPSCRFQKCLVSGMKKEAVQTTKLPAIPNFPLPASYTDPAASLYSHSFMPFMLFQTPPTATANVSLGLFPPQRPRARAGGEVVYELAAHILFSVVDWARKLPTFRCLLESDQINLLKMSWNDLFLLESSRTLISMYIQQLHTSATLQSKLVSMESILERMEHARLFHEQMEKIRTLGMDPTEHFHIKCIVLFKTDGSPTTQPQQIEVLQDTSQSSLEQYIRSQYPSQTTRFGKLLLMLSSLRKLEPAIIEQLFFAEALRGASIGNVLKKMLISSSCAQPTLAVFSSK